MTTRHRVAAYRISFRGRILYNTRITIITNATGNDRFSKNARRRRTRILETCRAPLESSRIRRENPVKFRIMFVSVRVKKKNKKIITRFKTVKLREQIDGPARLYDDDKQSFDEKCRVAFYSLFPVDFR